MFARESILIALGNKYTLRSIERSIYAHSFAESLSAGRQSADCVEVNRD